MRHEVMVDGEPVAEVNVPLVAMVPDERTVDTHSKAVPAEPAHGSPRRRKVQFTDRESKMAAAMLMSKHVPEMAEELKKHTTRRERRAVASKLARLDRRKARSASRPGSK